MSEQDETQVINANDDQNTQVVEDDDIASQLELEPEQSDDDKENNEAEEQKTEEEQSTEGDQKAEEDDVKEADKDKPDEEAERRRHNYEMAQRRIQEREAAKKQVEQSIDQAYKPQAVDELTQKYMDEGYDQFQAQMLARDERREQQAQISEARASIAELNMQIETEALQVMHDFPVFDPKSPEYDKDFHQKASSLYLRAAGEVRDPRTGHVVQTNLTPYEFYKELAEARNAGLSQAQIKAQRAAEQQMAAAAPPTSNAPVIHKSKEDEQADALEAAFQGV